MPLVIASATGISEFLYSIVIIVPFLPSAAIFNTYSSKVLCKRLHNDCIEQSSRSHISPPLSLYMFLYLSSKEEIK